MTAVVAVALGAGSFAQAADWPAWRGAAGIGVCTEEDLPLRWSPTENVRWRIPLPEAGNSTPIVVAGRVFVTQPVGPRRTLMCFDRRDGKLLWQQGVQTAAKETTHGTNPHCSASPVSDGQRVVASFASDGLFCYDLEGRELWRRTDLGKQVHIWGNASSPVLHGGLCYLNFGPGVTTYLIAVDKTTGKTVWKHDEQTDYGKPLPADPKTGKRGNPTYIGSWATPVIMKVQGREQLLMGWPRRMAAYDPATGKELWSCEGLKELVYTSPIHDGEIAVVLGGFGGPAMAIRTGPEGKLDASQVLWHHPRNRQRIGSAVIRGGHMYLHTDPGYAQCYELATGKLVWEERLTGQGRGTTNWSSVLLAGERCYTITQGGDCFVFRASPKFELLAVNSLGERSNSSIAASDGELFIRTHKALWCIK
ncbi:MAG: outer membrane biogenesis protein BamB [Planctomycetes bacterium ADurb.Bin126]|nr:MAG: outer membrane biogenesis protein BamB [Planctomycetes bacterium ADurb.Bin126]